MNAIAVFEDDDDEVESKKYRTPKKNGERNGSGLLIRTFMVFKCERFCSLKS